MKKTTILSFLFLILILSSSIGQAQSFAETKVNLFNKIHGNNPSYNEHNEVFCDMNITKDGIEKLAFRPISDADYPFTFIYCYTHYFEGFGNWGWSDYYIFDIRDVISISVDRKPGKSNSHSLTDRRSVEYNFHTMTLLLSSHHTANKVKTTHYVSDPNNKPISKIVLSLPDNLETVESIKKAFIHLGNLVGNEITLL